MRQSTVAICLVAGLLSPSVPVRAQSGGDPAIQLLSTTNRNIWTIQGDGPGAVRQEIRVPHLMHDGATGYAVDFSSRTFTYELGFDVLAAVNPLPRKLLYFKRANWRADVTLNGHAVGSHLGGAASFELEVTPYLLPTGNVLRVVVSDFHHLLAPNAGLNGELRLQGLCGTESSWDFYRGIYDDVYLVGVNDVRFERDEYFVWGTLRGEYDPAARFPPRINARTGFVNAGAQEATVRAVYRFSAGGLEEKVLATPWVAVPAGEARRIEASDAWYAPRLWWPHDPFLYEVTVTLEDTAYQPLDTRTFRFGFRDFYCRKADFTPYRDPQGAVVGDMWLNGVRIRPRLDTYEISSTPGAILHLWAPWINPGLLDTFLQRSKDHHVNTIRLGGGGWPSRVFERAQELGILIVAESPFHGSRPVGYEDNLAAYGHAGYLYNAWDPADPASSDAFWDMARRQVREWTRECRQYACVAMYSAENEIRRQMTPSAWADEPYVMTNLGSLYGEILKEDPSREILFSGETANLHGSWTAHPADPADPEKAVFVVDTHYMNGAGCRNRSSLPGHEPWAASFETLRTDNALPYSQGEYFWASGGELEARPQLFGGFASDPQRLAVADLKLAYAQTMGYRTYRHWDLFGFFAAGDDGTDLDMLLEAFKPVTFYCRTRADAYSAGQAVHRTYVLMNDSPSDEHLTLSVTGTDGGGRIFFTFTKDYDIAAGDTAEETVQFQAPGWRTGTTFALDVTLSRQGVAVHESRLTMQLVRPQRFSVGHTLYYLAGDTALAGLLTQYVSGTCVALATVGEIGSRSDGVFVLQDRTFTTPENNAVKAYLANGGFVVYLASDPNVTAMPRWFTGYSLQIPRNSLQKPYAYAAAFKDPAATGRIADGIIDTDLTTNQALAGNEPFGHLRFWGDDPLVERDENLIAEKCILLRNDPTFQPIVRATNGTDSAMANVLLARIAQGQGAVWVSTLELVEKARLSPSAATILRLLLQNARD